MNKINLVTLYQTLTNRTAGQYNTLAVPDNAQLFRVLSVADEYRLYYTYDPDETEGSTTYLCWNTGTGPNNATQLSLSEERDLEFVGSVVDNTGVWHFFLIEMGTALRSEDGQEAAYATVNDAEEIIYTKVSRADLSNKIQFYYPDSQTGTLVLRTVLFDQQVEGADGNLLWRCMDLVRGEWRTFNTDEIVMISGIED